MKPLERQEDTFKLSPFINFRNMRGKLFAVKPRPDRPYEYGNLVMIDDKRYIVKGICVVNGRFNMNMEEATIQ